MTIDGEHTCPQARAESADGSTVAPPTSSRPRSKISQPTKNAIRTELTGWPVVVHRVIGTPPVHEVDAYLHRAGGILEQGRRHVVVVDCTLQGPPSEFLRRAQAEWNREHESALGRHCVGTAVVIPQEVVGFAKTMSLLVWSSLVHCEVFATFDQAHAWALERVTGAHRSAG
jgi:hypothetical protein